MELLIFIPCVYRSGGVNPQFPILKQRHFIALNNGLLKSDFCSDFRTHLPTDRTAGEGRTGGAIT